MHFVNLYLVVRVSGGPEEGGWYYTAGEAKHSIPCHTSRRAERCARLVEKIADAQNSQRRSDIGSVLSEGRYEVVIERAPACSYPLFRPRWDEPTEREPHEIANAVRENTFMFSDKAEARREREENLRVAREERAGMERRFAQDQIANRQPKIRTSAPGL
jgi:hypothetical protein